MENFIPIQGFLGGCLMGLATATYLLGAGRVSGISGFMESLMRSSEPGFGPALAFLVGLPLGVAIIAFIAPGVVPAVELQAGPGLLIIAGLLIGFGARMAGGCTSGHGLCGMPRLSARSFAATGIFMASAAVTVFVTRHLI